MKALVLALLIGGCATPTIDRADYASVHVAPHPEALPTFVAKTVAILQAFDDIPEAAIRAIGAPTLVMVGDKDVILPEHAMQLARLLPR